MRKEVGSSALSTFSLPIMVLFLLGSFVLPSFNLSRSQAQAASPITPSGLNTQVNLSAASPAGKVQYDITGGTRPGGGTNLFHSFGDFNVPNNNIANFLNETALPTSNILGRVTGSNISNIFGTIQTTGFGNANLFMINPAGFLFGPNATVSVGGMVAFTSADYLRLADGVLFNAIPNATADALLSAAPVAAFGFLGSNPGAITVQGSQLSVTPGQSISLVGGNITVQSGVLDDGVTVQPARLTAPGGQINLASVASPGEILLPNLQSAPNINGQSFTAMGNISLSQGSLLDVSADAAGTVRIRGGQLVIADATISADTGNTNGASTAIDINVTGDLSITDTRGIPALTARTTGNGDAGAIQITSGNLRASSSFNPLAAPSVLIDSETAGTGRGGNININTGNLSVAGLAHNNAFTFINSGTAGPGNGGDVTITANNILLDWTGIGTGDFTARNTLPDSSGISGSAGTLTITANSFQLQNSVVSTEAFSALADTQAGGDLVLNVHDINMINGQIGSTGIARGGAITINTDTLHTDFSFFESTTVSGPGGGITVNARAVELTNGSTLVSSTVGDGNAGDIQVTATDHVNLQGHSSEDNPQGVYSPSGLFSNSFGGLGTNGNAGTSL